MPSLLDRQVRGTLFGLWCLGWLIVAVLLLAPLRIPIGVSYADLFGHFLAFALLAFGAVGFSHRGIELTLLAGLTIAWGAALEVAQGWVPYRTFDILDIGANTLGAMVGYGAAMTVLLLVIRPAADARARQQPMP